MYMTWLFLKFDRGHGNFLGTGNRVILKIPNRKSDPPPLSRPPCTLLSEVLYGTHDIGEWIVINSHKIAVCSYLMSLDLLLIYLLYHMSNLRCIYCFTMILTPISHSHFNQPYWSCVTFTSCLRVFGGLEPDRSETNRSVPPYELAMHSKALCNTAVS